MALGPQVIDFALGSSEKGKPGKKSQSDSSDSSQIKAL
jgi:hypothetical protein